MFPCRSRFPLVGYKFDYKRSRYSQAPEQKLQRYTKTGLILYIWSQRLRSSDLVRMTALHSAVQSLNAQQQIISISANDDSNRALIKAWCQRPVDEREPRQENTKWKIFMEPEKQSFVWWTHTHTHFHLQALCCLVFSCILQKERSEILQTHCFIFYWYTVCVWILDSLSIWRMRRLRRSSDTNETTFRSD